MTEAHITSNGDFHVSSGYVSYEDAQASAKELEKAIGEVMNGDRKASNLPVEPMVKLIEYVRQRPHIDSFPLQLG